MPVAPEMQAPHDEPLGTDSDLGDVWRLSAHRMTDTGLLLCVSVSILSIAGLAVIGLLHAHSALRWWPAVLPPIFAGAFGTWGIADREITERRRGTPAQTNAIRLLVGLEWASCIAAGLAAAAAIVVFLRLAVGTWIS